MKDQDYRVEEMPGAINQTKENIGQPNMQLTVLQ